MAPTRFLYIILDWKALPCLGSTLLIDHEGALGEDELTVVFGKGSSSDVIGFSHIEVTDKSFPKKGEKKHWIMSFPSSSPKMKSFLGYAQCNDRRTNPVPLGKAYPVSPCRTYIFEQQCKLQTRYGPVMSDCSGLRARIAMSRKREEEWNYSQLHVIRWTSTFCSYGNTIPSIDPFALHGGGVVLFWSSEAALIWYLQGPW